jgi:hypothetical protein
MKEIFELENKLDITNSKAIYLEDRVVVLKKELETLKSLLSVILDVTNKSFKSTNERIDTVNKILKENK